MHRARSPREFVLARSYLPALGLPQLALSSFNPLLNAELGQQQGLSDFPYTETT